MSDKLATALPKIAKMLLAGPEHQHSRRRLECCAAMLMATLKEVDPSGHEITSRIEGLDDVEMQEIFDAGREQGRTGVIEQQRTNHYGPNGDVRQYRPPRHSSGPHFPGTATHNGYKFSEIAESCHRNAFRVPLPAPRLSRRYSRPVEARLDIGTAGEVSRQYFRSISREDHMSGFTNRPRHARVSGSFLARVQETCAGAQQSSFSRSMRRQAGNRRRIPASHLQGAMFNEVASIGVLDVQTLFFRGSQDIDAECKASGWMSDPIKLTSVPAERRHLQGRPDAMGSSFSITLYAKQISGRSAHWFWSTIPSRSRGTI